MKPRPNPSSSDNKENKSGRLKASASGKTGDRITKLILRYQAIPLELTRLNHWVLYRVEEREKPDGSSYTTKVPYNPKTRKMASASDPTTWSSFKKTVSAFKNGGYNGIGFVFSKNDPYAGIVLDHCIKDGEISEWAKPIIKKLNCYAEKSPSGHGINILVSGSVPEGGNKDGHIKMYSSGDFITMTGDKLEDAPTEIKKKTKTLQKLLAGLPSSPTVTTDSPTASEETIIEELILDLEGENEANNMFNDLFYDGDISGYPSRDEADFALCSIVAVRTRNPEIIDKIFRQSKLYREQWDEKSGDKTYGEKIVQRALYDTRGLDKMDYTDEEDDLTEEDNVNVIGEVDKVDLGDIELDNKLIPVIPFPFDILPNRLVDVIYVMSKALYVLPEVVASIMLTIISGAVGNTVAVSLKEGTPIPLFMWLIIIAATGYGKSPLINTLLAPIYRLQAEAFKNYSAQLKKYEEDLKTGEEHQPEPKMRHYIMSDTTVEALADSFENDPHGVNIHQDEISGWISGLNQYKGGKGNDRQHYQELFNAGPMKIDRKTRSRFIPNTGAAIVGGIQTKIMPRVFDDESFDDGLLPRFLLLKTESMPFRFSRAEISDNESSYWTGLLNHMYGIPLAFDKSGSVQPKVLRYTEPALMLWADFYNKIGSILPSLADRSQVFIPKLLGYYGPKFAGILHCIKAYQNNKKIEGPIDPETVAAAIKLTQYFAGQDIKAIEIFSPSKEKDWNSHRVVAVLRNLEHEVENGKIAVSNITRSYNAGLSQRAILTGKNIGNMLRGLGLSTKKSTGGTYHLLWDDGKMQELFAKTMSTKSPTSTSIEGDNN